MPEMMEKLAASAGARNTMIQSFSIENFKRKQEGHPSRWPR